MPEQIRVVWSVGHETPGMDKIVGTEDRRQPGTKRRREDARAVGNDELVDHDIKRVRLTLDRLEGWNDILCPPDFERRDFEAERASRCMGLAHLQHGLVIANIKDNCQPAELGENLTQELYSLACKIRRLQRQSRDVAARLGQICDQAAADRVDPHRKHNRDNRGRLLYCRDAASDGHKTVAPEAWKP